ncbi:hypothetical protein NHX12_033351 [Muraenolepis orangiensis]|uniref:Fcf2 pre-rRNA processing C-terminal domain-containing protein n=1 Tax=Muraenolepis orangiensis TaxID=630683 RepID=A0A9Q0E5C9_9TELE|nr:hypothetical protein NHX12_033351 [Muraenolepis orangiensis]
MVATRRGALVCSTNKTNSDESLGVQETPSTGRRTRRGVTQLDTGASEEESTNQPRESADEEPTSPPQNRPTIKRCSRSSRLHSPQRPSSPAGSGHEAEDVSGVESDCSALSDGQPPVASSQRRRRRAQPPRTASQEEEAGSEAESVSDDRRTTRRSTRVRKAPERPCTSQSDVGEDEAKSQRATRSARRSVRTRAAAASPGEGADLSDAESCASGASKAPASAGGRASRSVSRGLLWPPIPLHLDTASEGSRSPAPRRGRKTGASGGNPTAASEQLSCDSEGLESGPSTPLRRSTRSRAKSTGAPAADSDVLDSDNLDSDILVSYLAPVAVSGSQDGFNGANRMLSVVLELLPGLQVPTEGPEVQPMGDDDNGQLNESKLDHTVVDDADGTVLEDKTITFDEEEEEEDDTNKEAEEESATNADLGSKCETPENGETVRIGHGGSVAVSASADIVMEETTSAPVQEPYDAAEAASAVEMADIEEIESPAGCEVTAADQPREPSRDSSECGDEPPATQEVVPPATQEVVPPATQEVVPPATQEVVPPATQEVVPPATQEVVPPATQEVVPPATQEVVPPATQEVVPPATQEVVPPATQEVVPPATQEVVPPATQEELPATQEELPSTQEVVLPSTQEELPSTQEELPSVRAEPETALPPPPHPEPIVVEDMEVGALEEEEGIVLEADAEAVQVNSGPEPEAEAVDPVSEPTSKPSDVFVRPNKGVITLLDSSSEEEEMEEDGDDDDDEDECQVLEDRVEHVGQERAGSSGLPPDDIAANGLFAVDRRPGQVADTLYLEAAEEEEEKDDFVDEEGDKDDDEDSQMLLYSRNLKVKELSTRIDPGLRVKELGGLYINFDGGKSKPVSNSVKKLKEQKHLDEVMKNSVMGPGFEKLSVAPPYNEAKRSLKLKRKEEKEKTTGDGWFNMKAPELTVELKADLKVIKMRGALDPKRFYKKSDREGLPKYFQVGTVMDSPTDFYHSRIPKKDRKRTMVEELVADADFRRQNKKKYRDIMAEKAAQASGRSKKKRFNQKKPVM